MELEVGFRSCEVRYVLLMFARWCTLILSSRSGVMGEVGAARGPSPAFCDCTSIDPDCALTSVGGRGDFLIGSSVTVGANVLMAFT